MAGSGSGSKASGNAAAFGRTYLRTTGAENTPPPERQPMTNDELIERLREHATDWNGDQMPGIEPAKGYPTAGTMRLAADRIKALSERVAELEAGVEKYYNAIHDWLHTYADDLCLPDELEERRV